MSANTIAVIEMQQKGRDANNFPTETLFKNPHRWSSNGVVATTPGAANNVQYRYPIWDVVRAEGAWSTELSALGISDSTGSWFTGESLSDLSAIWTYMKASDGYLHNAVYNADGSSTLDPDLNNAINLHDLYLLANNIIWARDNTISFLYWTDFITGATQESSEILWQYHPVLANSFSTYSSVLSFAVGYDAANTVTSEQSRLTALNTISYGTELRLEMSKFASTGGDEEDTITNFRAGETVEYSIWHDDMVRLTKDHGGNIQGQLDRPESIDFLACYANLEVSTVHTDPDPYYDQTVGNGVWQFSTANTNTRSPAQTGNVTPRAGYVEFISSAWGYNDSDVAVPLGSSSEVNPKYGYYAAYYARPEPLYGNVSFTSGTSGRIPYDPSQLYAIQYTVGGGLGSRSFDDTGHNTGWEDQEAKVGWPAWSLGVVTEKIANTGSGANTYHWVSRKYEGLPQSALNANHAFHSIAATGASPDTLHGGTSGKGPVKRNRYKSWFKGTYPPGGSGDEEPLYGPYLVSYATFAMPDIYVGNNYNANTPAKLAFGTEFFSPAFSFNEQVGEYEWSTFASKTDQGWRSANTTSRLWSISVTMPEVFSATVVNYDTDTKILTVNGYNISTDKIDSILPGAWLVGDLIGTRAKIIQTERSKYLHPVVNAHTIIYNSVNSVSVLLVSNTCPAGPSGNTSNLAYGYPFTGTSNSMALWLYSANGFGAVSDERPAGFQNTGSYANPYSWDVAKDMTVRRVYDYFLNTVNSYNIMVQSFIHEGAKAENRDDPLPGVPAVNNFIYDARTWMNEYSRAQSLVSLLRRANSHIYTLASANLIAALANTSP